MMAIERTFVTQGYRNSKLDEFFKRELQRAGYAGMEIQRIPLGTKIILFVEKPGIVIGRRGKNIKEMTSIVEKEFKIENPQIEVQEVEVPELNPVIMAKQIAKALERGVHFRRITYSALRAIMNAGAKGVEITISGKITGQRARMEKFVEGTIKHSGEPAYKWVRVGYDVAEKKAGVIGVKVKIMPPETKLPDEIEIVNQGEK